MSTVSEDVPSFFRRAANATFRRRGVEQAIKIFQDHVQSGTPMGRALLQTAQETGLRLRDLQSFLTAHGLIEAAEYDYGHDDPTRRRPYRIDAYDHKSRPDMPLRYTGNYADNPMHDPAHLNEEEDGVLDRLHDMLRTAQIDDDEILAGIRLSPRGYQKAAARLGLAASEIPVLMQSLATNIRRERQRLQEDDLGVQPARQPGVQRGGRQRFTYETDFLDNVTVRDTISGKEAFLRGSEAMEMLDRLDGGEDEQAVLASYASIMEDGGDQRNEGDDGYEKEISADSGTYNFPWSVGGRSGTATARFRDRDGEFSVDVIHVRDAGGKTIDDPALTARLQQTAWDFIGDE